VALMCGRPSEERAAAFEVLKDIEEPFTARQVLSALEERDILSATYTNISQAFIGWARRGWLEICHKGGPGRPNEYRRTQEFPQVEHLRAEPEEPDPLAGLPAPSALELAWREFRKDIPSAPELLSPQDRCEML
jgi:hypothetical protein